MDIPCRVAKLEENMLHLRREMNEEREEERRKSDKIFEKMEELLELQNNQADVIARKSLELLEYNLTLRAGRTVAANIKYPIFALCTYLAYKSNIPWLKDLFK